MTMESPLTHDELHRIYYWLQRQRLSERRTMGEATLRDLEECEERVHRLWLETRPVVYQSDLVHDGRYPTCPRCGVRHDWCDSDSPCRITAQFQCEAEADMTDGGGDVTERRLSGDAT